MSETSSKDTAISEQEPLPEGKSTPPEGMGTALNKPSTDDPLLEQTRQAHREAHRAVNAHFTKNKPRP